MCSAMESFLQLLKLPREVWVLAIAAFVNRAGTMVLAFMTLWLTERRGFSIQAAGTLMAVYGVASLTVAPMGGRLCDRYGAVRVMLAALVLGGLTFAAIPFVHGVIPLYAIAIAAAVLGEVFRPANMTALAQCAPPDKKRQSFALMRVSINLGMSVGPAIGGYLAAKSPAWFDAIFWADGGTTLAAAVLIAMAGLSKTSAGRPSTVAAATGSDVSIFRERRLLLFLLAMQPILWVFFQLGSTLPIFMRDELHLPKHNYGLLFTINTLIIVAVEIPLSAKLGAVSARRTLPWGAALMAIGFGMYGFAGGLTGCIIATVVWTVGEMVLFPGLSARVTDIAPEGRTGWAMGWYSMAFGVSFAGAPLLGAYLFTAAGGLVMWSILGVAGLASAYALRAACREV